MIKTKRKIKRSIFAKLKVVLFIGLLTFVLFFILFLGYQALFGLGDSLVSPLPKHGKTQGKIVLPHVESINLIEQLLQKNNIAFSRVAVASESSYFVYMEDGGQVILTSKKPLTDQISSLQLILTRLTIEGKKFKSLDFRFGKVVVVFEK